MDRLEIIKGKIARSLDQHEVAILDWSDAEWLVKKVEKSSEKEKSYSDGTDYKRG